MHSNSKKFLFKIKEELANNQWNLRFVPQKNLKSCRGYCDEANKEIVVTKGIEDISIVAHEFAHYLEIKNKTKSYIDFYKNKKIPTEIINEYCKGNINYSKEVKNAFIAYRYSEYYCDSLAYRLLCSHRVPFNKIDYIKKSNIQLVMFHFIEKEQNDKIHFRHFYNKNSMNIIPTKFKKSYVYKVTQDVYDGVINSTIGK